MSEQASDTGQSTTSRASRGAPERDGQALVEVYDQIVTRIFGAGLRLASTLSLDVGDEAAARIRSAIAELDQALELIRRHAIDAAIEHNEPI